MKRGNIIKFNKIYLTLLLIFFNSTIIKIIYEINRMLDILQGRLVIDVFLAIIFLAINIVTIYIFIVKYKYKSELYLIGYNIAIIISNISYELISDDHEISVISFFLIVISLINYADYKKYFA